MGKSRKTLDQRKGKLTVLEREKRKASEEKANSLQKIDLDPPYWLDDKAKEEYKRIVPLLSELPIASLDLALVSAYCQAFSDYVNATIRMNEGDAIVETERGTKLNQNHAIKRDALAQINSIAPKIGLSIDARLKIFTPKEDKKETDEFEEMINGK